MTEHADTMNARVEMGYPLISEVHTLRYTFTVLEIQKKWLRPGKVKVLCEIYGQEPKVRWMHVSDTIKYTPMIRFS